MGRPPEVPPYEVQAVIDHLRHAKARILHCVEWARTTAEVWNAFNSAGETRKAVAASDASEAAYVYEKATLDAQIVMVTRVLDGTGHRHALHSNRLSLPVCRDLLALPGVEDQLAVEAAGWNDLGEASSQQVRDRLVRFRTGLDLLAAELPNRAAQLRDFRDENIAHELHFPEPRERPQYRYIGELLREVMDRTEDLAFVVQGEVIRWRHGEGEESAQALWHAVAAAYPIDDD